MENPSLQFVRAGAVELAVWEWPGAGPPLLFAHATGFHGRCWDQVVRAFPGRRRLAVEFRGHGRSATPAPPYGWRAFGADIAAVTDSFELQGAIGIGHSMGGHALVSCAAMRPYAFATLLLIDPVILPPERYGAHPVHADFILRRRARWASPEQMFDSFHVRRPFREWRPEVLRDYCDWGLLADDGGFTLACPPQIEASIYAHSNAPDSNLYPEIPAIKLPVTVLRADAKPAPGVFDLSASPTWPGLAGCFPNGRDIPLAGRNHYIPMETPELVVEQIRAALS